MDHLFVFYFANGGVSYSVRAEDKAQAVEKLAAAWRTTGNSDEEKDYWTDIENGNIAVYEPIEL